jgi:hypothetical protein
MNESIFTPNETPIFKYVLEIESHMSYGSDYTIVQGTECMYSAGLLISLQFDPEDGGYDMFFRNVS